MLGRMISEMRKSFSAQMIASVNEKERMIYFLQGSDTTIGLLTLSLVVALTI